MPQVLHDNALVLKSDGSEVVGAAGLNVVSARASSFKTICGVQVFKKLDYAFGQRISCAQHPIQMACSEQKRAHKCTPESCVCAA